MFRRSLLVQFQWTKWLYLTIVMGVMGAISELTVAHSGPLIVLIPIKNPNCLKATYEHRGSIFRTHSWPLPICIQTGSEICVSLCCFALIWSHKFAIVCRSFSHVVPISLDEARSRGTISYNNPTPLWCECWCFCANAISAMTRCNS